jgi:hypothetical protein
MKKSKFTERQIAFALQQAENGTKVAEAAARRGLSANKIACADSPGAC